MSRILITNPLLVATMDDSHQEFIGGHVLIEDGVIQSIGPETADFTADEIIDATGMVVIPGFINTHHHFYQTLTRNIPLMQNLGLFDWLTNHYELWLELTLEAIYCSAKSAILELMRSGTTTSSDHHYVFPRDVSGELIDAQIQAAREMGIRFHPTRGSMSRGRSNGGLPPDEVVQSEQVIQRDTERLLARYHDQSEGSMLRLGLAPCSPFSVTPALMKSTVEFAKANSMLIHTHLAETLDEEKYCLDNYGRRPLEYIDSLGWITEFSWFAHAVHLNDAEVGRLGDVGSGISHCPSSNLRLGSGIARIRELLDAGVKVSLGVDGSASNDGSNMLAEIRQAMLLSRLRDEQYWLTARDVLKMATRGGADALGRSDIGQLAVGKRADIALFSTSGIEYAGSGSDPLAALVFTVHSTPVDYLIVDGKIQIRNGGSMLDEAELLEQHNRLAAAMIRQATRRSGIDFLKHKNGV
ncbi:MAG: 8-oxoguanine deaminase [Candidatus Marinimicrobia bacterium]|nr:8-oxoguanine deaminase [Candidatus Neomarinimicrobiota bacterium]